ncbi:uncharacterized protein LOC125775342 [Bactrocera dorsalis]|uniref:Uncharacterized protein LOC125775342 n=1 Tax=Bactrocera dorsalis TaxID=27457 RepID=A0A034VVD8_BACDO|nr:uncharacterized protein LOC125775342 [Bactrocera dorsalis]
MVSRMNEQFWKEFFELYRSFQELWQVKSECYKNKNKKNAAYEVLLTKLREIDSNASLDNLKSKINSLRSSYRRELKKKKRSEKSGAGVEDIHIPTLWYFDDLSFLEDQEVQLSGHSSIEIEENEGDIVEENRPPSAKKYKKDYSRKERSELLAKAVEALDNSNQPKDDASTLSSTWGLLFRKLSSTQQLFANKAIMEVLYQGALERLDESSYKLFENKTTHNPPRSSSTPFFSSDTSSAASQYFVSTPLQSPELMSLQSHAHQLQPSRAVIIHQSRHHSGPQQPQFAPAISINSHANGNDLDPSTKYSNFNELFTDSDYS